MDAPLESVVALRDRLIELVSVGNLKHRPEALFALFRQFLRRLTLPRLCHFLGLVLPQLTPVRAPWVDATRTLWTCHHIRACAHKMQVLPHFLCHQETPCPQWVCSLGRPVPPAPCAVHWRRSTGNPVADVKHLRKRPTQCSAVTMQTQSQMGLPVSTACFPFVLPDLWSTHVQLGQPERPDSHGHPLGLCSTEGRSCLSSVLIGYAVGSVYVQLDLETDTRPQEPPLADQRTRGAAGCPSGLAHGEYCHATWRSMQWQLSAVYTNMAPERLCLGCGLRVEEKFTPISPGERGRLFAASVKLLQFALRAVSASASEKELTEEEGALLRAIRPLVRNTDCHFLAALTALVQSILEGRTDCPISGVFGAGKTRAAAAMIGGLLVMDPTLKVMVVTKENAAAHAFTKHVESLQLPPSIQGKVGRLVGATELQKGPASKTDFDVPPAFRNDVLRGKQVIIGCGGGFHQECSQPYSPVARWMADVDVALNDEGQQFGNLDESSAIARVPRKGLVIWCGDHKQTPGGLRKSEEARAFRRKLMRRPIALRGDTKFIPPHMLGVIVLPYVQGVPGPQVAGLRQLLQESARQPLDLSSTSVTALQELCQETIGRCWDAAVTPCCCAAIAVLWLALSPEKFPLQADTFCSAAGTAGKQKWALILPSSARVSELTYVTIVGTRYPELDTIQFCPFFGMHPTATYMPVLTLERWWTGSGACSRWLKMGTRTLQCYTIATRWWMPLPPRNG